jgi:hypothetical protein
MVKKGTNVRLTGSGAGETVRIPKVFFQAKNTRGPAIPRWEGSGCLYRDWLSSSSTTLTRQRLGEAQQHSAARPKKNISNLVLAPQSQSIDFELRVVLEKVLSPSFTKDSQSSSAGRDVPFLVV